MSDQPGDRTNAAAKSVAEFDSEARMPPGARVGAGTAGSIRSVPPPFPLRAQNQPPLNAFLSALGSPTPPQFGLATGGLATGLGNNRRISQFMSMQNNPNNILLDHSLSSAASAQAQAQAQAQAPPLQSLAAAEGSAEHSNFITGLAMALVRQEQEQSRLRQNQIMASVGSATQLAAHAIAQEAAAAAVIPTASPLNAPFASAYGAAAGMNVSNAPGPGKVVATGANEEESWDRYFAALCQFKRLTGHLDVPMGYRPDPSLGLSEQTLGQWALSQRLQFKFLAEGNSTTSLTVERASRLNEIGFKLVSYDGYNPAKTWMQRFTDLCQFKEEHGHTSVPQRYKKNQRLGIW